MAWTTPRTWSPGETVTASLMNAHLRDNLNVLKVPINDSGKIIALSSTYLADLSGANLTGLPAPRVNLFQDAAAHQGTSTGETDASTYTLPGGTLAADGDVIYGYIKGKTAAGTSTRTIKLYWNGASVGTHTTAIASCPWLYEFWIQRLSGTTQLITTRFTGGVSTTPTLNSATPTTAMSSVMTHWDGTSPSNATLSGNVAIKTTVQDSSAGANVTQQGFFLSLLKA
jgi:hypothetical protein